MNQLLFWVTVSLVGELACTLIVSAGRKLWRRSRATTRGKLEFGDHVSEAARMPSNRKTERPSMASNRRPLARIPGIFRIDRRRQDSEDEPAGAALEGKAQGRALRVVDMLLLEDEDLPVDRETGDDADLPAVQAHGERGELCGSNFITRLRLVLLGALGSIKRTLVICRGLGAGVGQGKASP